MASENRSKADIISERQANLPLPEQPPTASDWNSADARNVNVGLFPPSSQTSKSKTDKIENRLVQEEFHLISAPEMLVRVD